MHFVLPRSRWDTWVGLAIGLVVATALFLTVPLTQMMQHDDPRRRVLEETRIAIEAPEVEEDLFEPEPVEREEPKLELEDPVEAPKLSLEQLDIALNSGTGGSIVGDFSMPTLGGATARDLDPEEFVDFADLDQMPRPIGVTGFDFPHRLKRKKVQGRIVLLLKLSTTGEVISAKVESSNLPQFDDFIRNEVESWRFTPPTQQGKPVKAHARLPIPIKIG